MGSMGETTGSGTGETTGSGNEETTGAETTASIGGSTAAAATTTPTPAPTTAASNAFTAEFCADNAEHTMCKYTGIGSVCTADPNHITGFTTAGKDLILQKHNELRSKVASGNEAGQPAATNMRRLVWNQELETVAQRWADQCTFGHDDSRNKIDGTYVGQNAYIAYNSRASTQEALMAAMDGAVQAWYDEVTNPGFSAENIDPYAFSSGTGHYTQVVWAETTELGCGWSYFKDGSWYKSLVVCNYAKGGNMIGASMYQTGTACSACPAGTSCDSDKLCA